MSKSKVSTTHRWLLLLPFLWQVGFAPLVNGIVDRPFSLPFPMFWQMLGTVFTSVIIAIVYWLDRFGSAED